MYVYILNRRDQEAPEREVKLRGILRHVGVRLREKSGVCLMPWGSAVWPQCWLCAACAVGRVGCCVGDGYLLRVSISSS